MDREHEHEDEADLNARIWRGEAPLRWGIRRVVQPGEITAEWSCPVCNAETPRRHRPGRARVYCSNACRQRAYRWRRRTLPAPEVDRAQQPFPERSRTRDRTHAMRRPGDFVAGRADSAGREVTACGAFGRPAHRSAASSWHTLFVPGDGPSSCRRCAELLQVPTVPIEPIVELATRRAPFDPAYVLAHAA